MSISVSRFIASHQSLLIIISTIFIVLSILSQIFLYLSATAVPNSTPSDWKTFSNVRNLSRPFPGFAFDYPPDWNLYLGSDLGNGAYQPYESRDINYTVTLTKGEYRVMLGRADGGAALCVFNDSEASPDSIILDLRQADVMQLDTSIGVLRRVIDNHEEPSTLAIFCSYQADLGWVAGPTEFGIINYRLPTPYEETFVAEMDAIVSTIRPIK